jgi:hypothetical protein
LFPLSIPLQHSCICNCVCVCDARYSVKRQAGGI